MDVKTAHSQSWPLISVIVPIYKVEKYLDRCINSIVNQTYTNLEIILVDDGSPDNCPAICDEWADKDDRIRVIHKENGGLSSARNAGLDIARGELIGFVDSDDFILPEMYESLYRLMSENNADLTACRILSFENEEDINVNRSSNFVQKVISGNEILTMFAVHDYCSVVVMNKLYKSEIFTHLRFLEGFIHEDEIIMHRILGECRITVTTTEPLYLSYINQNSIMGKIRSSRFHFKSLHDSMYAFTDRYNYLLSKGRYDISEFAKRGFYGTVKYTLLKVNYIQYRKELSEYTCYTLKKLLFSKNIGNILRGFYLALVWLRSLFRPYVKENDS